MDNVNQPRGRDPQGHQPTQPFRFTPGGPAGVPGHDQPASSYDQAPPDYGQAPGYGQVPPGYGQAPPGYGPAPPEYGQVPAGYGRETAQYGQVPSQYYQGAPGQPGQPGGPYRTPRTGPRRRALRWGAGITAAALLGAGGALAGLKLTGNDSIPANSAQATALNNALSPSGSASCRASAGSSPAGSQASGQSGTQAGQGRRVRCHPHRFRLLRLVRGMYGEVAFYTSHGTEMLAYERGSIVSVTGNTVVVRARDNTTWTWTLASDSIIREAAGAATSSALAAGERVFVGGQASGSTRDIRLILVRGQGQGGSQATQPGSQGTQPGSRGTRAGARRSPSSHSPSGTFTLPPH